MTKLDMVGLGLTALDVLMRLKEFPTWEHGTRFSAFGYDGGGPAGTATVAASRLGAKCGFVGTHGNDEMAELKLKSLTDNNVDISRMVACDCPERQVILVCVQEDTGERVFSGYGGWGEQELDPAKLDKEYITSADYLHLDGTHREAATVAAKWMKEAGKTVVIDCSATGGRPIDPERLEILQYVDVLICGSGFGTSATGETDPWKIAEKLMAMGPTTVVQTEGEEGSYTMTADERFHTPALDIEPLDTTGAGDVFHGAYIVGMLKGWTPQEIARFCTCVSALECMRFGGRKGIPYYDEVIAFMKERGVELPKGA